MGSTNWGFIRSSRGDSIRLVTAICKVDATSTHCWFVRHFPTTVCKRMFKIRCVTLDETRHCEKTQVQAMCCQVEVCTKKTTVQTIGFQLRQICENLSFSRESCEDNSWDCQRMFFIDYLEKDKSKLCTSKEWNCKKNLHVCPTKQFSPILWRHRHYLQNQEKHYQKDKHE